MTERPDVKELTERVLVEDTMEMVAPQGWREEIKARLEAKAREEGYETLPETFVATRDGRNLDDLSAADRSPWVATIKVYRPKQ